MKPFQLGEVFGYLKSHKLSGKDLRKILRLAPVTDRLAIASDREGMEPEGVRKFPDVLKTYSLEGIDITDLMCREARRANAEQFAKLLAKVPKPHNRVEEFVESTSGKKSTPEPKGDSERSEESSVKKKEKERQEAPPKITLFGYPPTSIVRWLGANGYPLSAAESVVDYYGLPISKSTISTQWRAGTKGERGEPAPLTKEQVAELVKTCKIKKV